MSSQLAIRIVLVTFFVLTSFNGGFAQQVEPPRTISTAGESVVYVVPDEVVVTLGIETFDKGLDESKSANDAASKTLLAAFKNLGVEERHIQTNTLEVEIRYRSNRPWEGIEGYIARRAYSVTLKDAKKLEPAIDAALKNGANQLMGIAYHTSELRKHRDQARKMAIKAAKEKAVALAGELAATVGAPRSISEGHSGHFGSAYRSNSFNSSQNVVQVNAGGGGESGAATPMGQIGISASVNVVFDLTP